MKTRFTFRILLPAMLLAAGSRSPAAILINENFTSTGGGFVELAPAGAPASPWAYNAAGGLWSVAGEGTGPVEDEISSPQVTLASAAALRLTFSHRYNFEEGWDGGAVQYSVDGGEWLDVNPLDFVQNPYGPPVIGTGSLKDKRAFSGASAGYAASSFITTIVDIPQQAAGAKVKLRFLGAWDEGTATAAPNWEVTSVMLETLADTDSDGMPDVYEDANGLNKTLNDAAADLDNDGLSNIAEYNKYTKPNVADTDGDGYKDGVETESGAWGSATDTGTNPLDPDTDGDGLLDGVENPSLAYTGPTQTGSDPNNVDSDTDTWDDKTEVVFTGNPKDGAVLPTLGADALHVLASWNFNDASKPGSSVDQSHGFRGKIGGRAAYGADASGRSGLAGDRALNMGPVQAAGTTMAVAGGTFLNFTGANDQVCVSFWQKLDSVSSSNAFFGKNLSNPGGDTRGISAHATWGDNNFYWDTAGCCDQPGQRLVKAKPASLNLAGAWHHIAFQKNGPLKEIWVDGVLIATQTGSSPLPQDFTSLFVGSGDNGAGNIQGYIDDFTIYAEALTEKQIQSLANGGSPLNLLGDADGDGILDNYEVANGLNKDSAADRDTDLDGDGLSNFTEFTRGTKANSADSDGDGLSDKVETGTGTWASVTDTGTNPLNADTDGDGLKDGLENFSLASTGITQPGSNPNKKDSDEDGWDDYTEALWKTDNKTATSKPVLNALPLHLLAWWNFNDASNPATALDSMHGTPGSLQGGTTFTAEALGRSGGAGDRALDLGTNQSAGRTMSVPLAAFLNLAGGKDSVAISFWQKLTAVNASHAFYAAFQPAGGDTRGLASHSPYSGNTFYWDTSGCCAVPGQRLSVAAPGDADFTAWHHVVYQKNGPLKEIWLDGQVIASSEGASPLPSNFLSLFIGSGLNGGANMTGLLDDFAVYAEALTEAQIQRLASGDTPTSILPAANDTDGDGMLDVFEENNGLDKTNPGDRDTDLDNDGSSNYQEYLRGTLANNADSDGDGLKDGIESGTGIFVGVADTGTNPLKADSDEDGFPDALENKLLASTGFTQPGTDPNLADTDGDGWRDFLEVAFSSDPKVKASVPSLNPAAPVHLLAWWNFDDATNPAKAVDTIHSLPAKVMGNTLYTEPALGRSGGAGDRAMDFSAGQAMVVEEGSFMNIAAAQDQFAISFWQKLNGPTNATIFRFNSVTGGGGDPTRGISAHAPWSDGTFYFDTAGCCDANTMRISTGDPGVDLTGWRHIVYQKNGPLKEIWIDGVNILSGEGANPLPLDFKTAFIGGAAVGENVNGLVDDVAIFAEALTESQIQRLAAGNTPTSILQNLAPAPLITGLTFNPANRTLALTWNSSAGKQYKVERSTNLTNWITVAPNHPSGGASTSYNDANIPAAATRYFYRVSEL